MINQLLANMGLQELIQGGLIFDLGIIIVSAALIGIFAKFLRQPLVLSYIIAGIIIGPEFLGLVSNQGVIEILAELGVAFLLFIVGLELDLSKLKESGTVAVSTAIVEVLLIFSIGANVALFFGYTPLEASYLGLILTFSSTAILVKMLSDKNELDTLHGRIILGILLVEDVFAVVALSILTKLGASSLTSLGNSLLQGLGLIALAVVLSKYVIPDLLKQIDDSAELMFLVSMAVLFTFVGISSLVGFSAAIGGFIAGISLSSFPYNIEIVNRAKSLRDFFVTIFFVSLGMLVRLESILDYIFPLITFLIIVMVIKPFIIDIMLTLTGYSKRTSFMSGFSLSQISEFSLILAIQGLSLGHISQDIFSLVAVLMLVTVLYTSYIIKYDKTIYDKFSGFLFTLKKSSKEQEMENLPEEPEDHILICGAHEKGYTVLRELMKSDRQVVAIDYNPEVIRKLKRFNIPCIYGNATHPETLKRANFSEASLVISTIPDDEDSEFLINKTASVNSEAKVIVSTNSLNSTLILYDMGADYVIYPKLLASQKISNIVDDIRNSNDWKEKKREQIRKLEHRKEENILERFEPEFLKRIKRRVKEDQNPDEDFEIEGPE